MDRYFIHIEGGGARQQDDVGAEFATAALAIGEAAKMGGEMLRDDIRERLGDCALTVRVEGEGGVLVATIDLSLSVPTQT